jgi:hypothetical protein
MARSSYVYVVVDGYNSPRAAFTVKREMLAWVHRRGHGDWEYLRFPDGRGDDARRYRLSDDCEVR